MPMVGRVNTEETNRCPLYPKSEESELMERIMSSQARMGIIFKLPCGLDLNILRFFS